MIQNIKFSLLAGIICLLAFNLGYSQTMNNIRFEKKSRKITFSKNGFPLDFHCISNPVPFTEGFGKCVRWQHLQDMVRLKDANGKEYYMGTWSQNVDDSEGGMVFVAEVNKGGTSGKVIWCDILKNSHPAGGYNHPGDLRVIENTVIIAGQNWDKSYPVGKDLNMGNGGNHVLFYDISNPARPRYSGKLNRCQNIVATSEIDAIAAIKIGSYYYISFNGVPNRGSVTCKCNDFSANGAWKVIQDFPLNWSSNIEYEAFGQKFIGGAGDGSYWVTFDKLEMGKRVTTFDSPILHTSFDDGTTFNLSVLESGLGVVVYANVESDDYIEIEVIESKNQIEPVRFTSTAGFGFRGLAQLENIIYLTTQGADGIYKYDITTFNKPEQIPSTAGMGFSDIIQVGNIIYLTTQGADGIFKFDPSTQGQPEQIPSTAGMGFRNLIQVGNIIYLTTQGADGIFKFDPSTQGQPEQIPSTAGMGFRDLIKAGNIIYLTTQGTDGIFKFDPSTQGQPEQIPSTASLGFRNLIKAGNIIYLTTQGADGIWTMETFQN